MAVREVHAPGLGAVALATALLQRARLADAEAGLWEAADVQWWWRTPRASDAVAQRFWVDDTGPVAAVLLTDWGRAWGCDPLVVPGAAVGVDEVWRRAAEAIDALGLGSVEVLVRDDDEELRELVVRGGFEPDEAERGGITWLAAESGPPVPALPDGFVLVDRARSPAAPHPMRGRNGEAVEERLRQCSLYDAALDLAIEAPTGDVAAYALFWFDPVTEVGLVEPMRVEDAYQRRGLGRALLAAGLDRLAHRGARRLKVGFSTEPARALYLAAGFRVAATDTTYRRGSRAQR
ncbi:MAG TPA: GNAT family N-acetyltransferase [Gaiellaceae bacterium]|nr:GNAT family N-acetyltransferase [Gaiellaceae bacterium]